MYKVTYNDISIRRNDEMENSLLFALSLHRESNEPHTITVVDKNDFVLLTLFSHA